eukprot:NODE_762_length_4433_cov_0.172127.p4 type:complete len:160 gc:universal NODE_762_length_4433_cov_0.172127:2966-2487(-)
MDFLFLTSRQGKVRLIQWYANVDQKEKQKIIPDVISAVLNRKQKLANIIEYKNYKIVYKKYASLFFVVGTSDPSSNELLIMEEIHRFVEVLDQYFGNVCELDLIFSYHKAYYILNEYILSGLLVDSSKKTIVKTVHTADKHAEIDELQPSRSADTYISR